jgi:hypothetical protein
MVGVVQQPLMAQVLESVVHFETQYIEELIENDDEMELMKASTAGYDEEAVVMIVEMVKLEMAELKVEC